MGECLLLVFYWSVSGYAKLIQPTNSNLQGNNVKVEGRIFRITLGFAAPVLIVPVAILLLGLLLSFFKNEKIELENVLVGVLAVLFFSSIITLIPAIIYTFVMEFLINPKINNNILVVTISAVFGGLTGVPMYQYGWHYIGMVVGLLLGTLLRKNYIFHKKCLSP